MREGPEIALTFPFFNLPCGAVGMSNPLVCQHHRLQRHMKSGCDREGCGGGRLGGEDGISV